MTYARTDPPPDPGTRGWDPDPWKPGWQPEPPPPWPTRTIIVENPADDAAAAHHLAQFGFAGGRVVVRPTPGAADTRTLGLDVLSAAGKNPEAAKTERVSGTAWELAQAWLIGSQVTDVVVDRAHRLTGAQASAIGQLAAGTGASLWLIWGGPQPTLEVTELLQAARAIAEPATADVVDQGSLERIALAEFVAALPAPPPPLFTLPDQPATWSTLPTADFTTFLAQARRLLPQTAFTPLAQTYYATAEQADAWIAQHQHLIDPGEEFPVRLGGALAGWLRDHVLGPAPSPPAALVMLRAVQAALFVEGFLLSWDGEALGPDPAQRLPGDLTPAVAGALQAMCRTDTTAATALSLHLNHRPFHFDLIRCQDVAPDGSHIRTQVIADQGVHEALDGPNYTHRRFANPWAKRRTTDSAFWEMTGTETIWIPEAARPILAAHLAWRFGHGADGRHPFFVHPREPGVRPPIQTLREAISRTSRRLGLQAPWVHAGECTYGTDIARSWRAASWMRHRGLTLHPLRSAHATARR